MEPRVSLLKPVDVRVLAVRVPVLRVVRVPGHARAARPGLRDLHSAGAARGGHAGARVCHLRLAGGRLLQH